MRRHEHDARRAVPRRRPARGDAGDRAGDGSVRARRSGSIPPRCAVATSSPPTPSRCTTASGATLRLRRLRAGARPGARDGRLRGAARGAAAAARGGRHPSRSASASASTWRSPTASPSRSSAQSRSRRTARRSLRTGSFSHGQGHETTFAMIVADRLGLPLESVRVAQGRHRRGAPGLGHLRLEVDPDRRRRGATGST